MVKKVVLYYLNAQSLLSNKNQIEWLMSECKPDVLIVSESRLTVDIEECEYRISNYSHINCFSNSRHTGGVTAYVKSGLRFEVVNVTQLESMIWILKFYVWIDSKKWVFVGVYRSPSASINEFLCFYDRWCTEHLENENNRVIMGDFNIDLKANDVNKVKMLDLIVDQGDVQLVNEYTRITENSRTLIDYVCVNAEVQDDFSACVDTNFKISDHETIRVDLECNVYKNVSKKKKVLRYSKGKLENFLNINNFSDLFFEESFDSLTFKFSDLMEKAFDAMSVERVVNVNVDCQWYNSNLWRMKQEKINAFRDAIYSNNIDNWQKYKAIRNKYKTALVKTRNEYICSQLQSNSGNQTGTWRMIKALILKNNKSKDIHNVMFGEESLNDESMIANRFNSYFVQSVIEINTSIPFRQYDSLITQLDCDFKFRYVSVESLYNLIKNLNNKKDIIGVNRDIILKSIEVIGPVLVKIINSSLCCGLFPRNWKESTVIPVEKIVNTVRCDEFRPVNMLPTCEKILERLVANQLKSYLENNKILIPEQSGFREGHSCETALNWLIYEWKKEIDCKNSVIAVFLDFKRAFETIERGILVQKLEKYGIRGNELNWFRSYLTGRTQRTKVGNVLSEPLGVDLGVPQGSVLGVMLFLLYINDVKCVLKFCKIMLFADDALIYISGKNVERLEQCLNEDLESINNWLEMNKMKLNVKKTKCMKFKVNEQINIFINGEMIECVDSFKYLGVVLDSKLNFKDHARYVCGKIAKKVGFLRRIRKELTFESALLLYNSIVLPHFNYCASLMYACQQEIINRLQLLQNKAMRAILMVNVYTPIRVMLEMLNWMNVKQRLKYSAMLLIYKMKNKMVPEYLQVNVVNVGDIQPYNLRNNDNFRPLRCVRSSTQESVMYVGMNYFNNLPGDIKNERSVYVFKKKLSFYIKNE